MTRRLLSAAGVALVAAIGMGLVPTSGDSTGYVFRPAEAQPGPLGAVAVLALAPSLEPAAIEVRVPCDDASSGSEVRTVGRDLWLVGEGSSASPLEFGQLPAESLVVTIGSDIVVTVDGEEILGAPVPGDTGCVATVGYVDGAWRLGVGAFDQAVSGVPPRISDVVVTGPAAISDETMISVLAADVGPAAPLPRVILAIVSIGSIALVVLELRHHGGVTGARGRSDRRWDVGAVAVDAAVVGSLIGWAFLVPVSFDDAWQIANGVRQDPFQGLDVFFQQDLAQFLWGHWVGLFQHHWFGLSSSIVVMRVPNIVLGVATWLGLKRIGFEVGLPVRGGRAIVAASIFVAGYGAFGMAFRYEPIIAALLVASTLLAVRFSGGDDRGRLLAAWVGVLALGLNAHPTGIVVFAPLLVVWRRVVGWWRDDRDHRIVALTLLGLAASMTLLLYAWGSDLATQLRGIAMLRGDTHGRGFFDEPQRYRALAGSPQLMRVVLTAIGLGVLTFLGKRYFGRPPGRPSSHLPMWSLIAGVGLLGLVPSKHASHFGVFIGLGSLAVLAALLPTSNERAGDHGIGRHLAAGFGSLVGVSAMAWAWSSTEPWALFDLRTQQWWEGATNVSPLSLSSPATWLLLVGIAAVVGRILSRRVTRTTYSVTGVMLATAPVLAALLTSAAFALDAMRTDGWTVAGANIDALTGGSVCGLGDFLAVPAPGSLQALARTPDAPSGADIAAVGAGFDDEAGFAVGAVPEVGMISIGPLPGLLVHGSWGVSAGPPEATLGAHRSDWYTIPEDIDRVGLLVVGGFARPTSNAVAIQWADAQAALGVAPAVLDGHYSDWHLVMFEPPEGADRLRVLARDQESGVGIESWVGVTAPVAIDEMTLTDVLTGSQWGSFVTPALLANVPCGRTVLTDLPVVATPDILVREVPDDAGYVVWPRGDRALPYLAAASGDRYFSLITRLPPGDGDRVEVVVSQRYLTGASARTTGVFEAAAP